MTTNTFPHVLEVGSLGELASTHVAELDFGSRAFVLSANDSFYLQPSSSFPVDGTTVVSPAAGAIVGKPGAVWVISSKAGGGGGGGGTGVTVIVLPVDEVNGTDVLVPSALQVPVAPGQLIRVEWNLRFTADVANGIQFAVTAPAGSSGIVNAVVYPGDGSSPTGSTIPLNGSPVVASGTSELEVFMVAGIVNGGTAGFVGLEFSQVLAEGGAATRLLAGSSVMGAAQA